MPLSRFYSLLILLTLSLSPIAGYTAKLPQSLTPVSRDTPSWWMPRHEEKLAEAKKRGDEAELLFIGDSITHYWDEGVWAKRFGEYKPFNLGFSGDRTEHVLWRIQHGALENLSPKVTVLMIGTNNTGQAEGQPAQDTIQGIEAIIDEINKRLPDTQLILHAIFPRGATTDDPLRQVNAQINQALPAIAQAKGAEFLDINSLFLEKDGTLPKNVMPDLLHPKEIGYELWAEGLSPSLERLFGKAQRNPKRPVISLWPKGIPQPHDASLKETQDARGDVIRISNVDTPSITLYKAPGRRPTTAILVCPGGAYNILAWNKEGTEIAEWLNTIGISAAVLKYRTPQNREGALQDAQRALGLLRHRAAEWNIDPEKIGVLGFSAGGHLSATLSNTWQQRRYPAVDEADALSCRPDFSVLVYPAYLGDDNLNMLGDFKIGPQTPPAFIVQTQDDTKYVASAVAYYTELFKAKIPAEIHLFPHGGHGYGLRPSSYPVANYWGDLCRDWLRRL